MHHLPSTYPSAGQVFCRGLAMESKHKGTFNAQTLVGTTRSRVNFFMKKFQRLGFIDYKHTSR